MTLILHKGLHHQHIAMLVQLFTLPLSLTLLSLPLSHMRCSILPLFQLIYSGTAPLEEALAYMLLTYLLPQMLTSSP